MNKLSIWKILFLVFLIIGTVYILGKQKPYITHSGKMFGTFYNITYSSDVDLSKEIKATLIHSLYLRQVISAECNHCSIQSGRVRKTESY